MSMDDFILNEEEYEKIVERCEIMLKQRKQFYFDVHEFENLIDYYMDALNFQKAAIVTDIAIKQHPYCTEIEFRKAKLLIEQQSYNKALNILEKIEKIDKSNADIMILKGVCFLNLGSFKKAIDFFDTALALAPEIEEDNLYNISVAFLAKDKFDIALKYLLKSKNYISNNPLILYDTAFCYEKLGNNEKAIKYYNLYINQEPYSDNAWYNLGIIYTKTDKYNEAIAAFDYVLAINEEYTSAYFNKANCYANWEKFEYAIDSYKEYLEHDPQNVVALYYIGECYEKLDNQQTAHDYFKKCVETDNLFSDGWYGLAVVSYNLNQYTEGLDFIKQALKLEPDNAEYWYFNGELLTELPDKNSEIIASYKRATELNPNDPVYWISYADIMQKTKNTEAALKILRKGNTIIKNDAEILFTLAAYYYTLMDIKQSEEFFIEGYKADKDFVDAFFENCEITDIDKFYFLELIKTIKL